MKRKFIILGFCILTILTTPVFCFAETGMSQSLSWWDSLQKRLDGYGPYLQGIYRELEKTTPPTDITQAFRYKIQEMYPGTTFSGQLSGRLNIGGGMEVSFSSGWKIPGFTHKKGGRTWDYLFTKNSPSPSIKVTEGPNIVSLIIDPSKGKAIVFKGADFNSISRTAANVYALRTPEKTTQHPFAEILTDIYLFRINEAPNPLRIDKFIDRVMDEPGFRDWILDTAKKAYLKKEIEADMSIADFISKYISSPVIDKMGDEARDLIDNTNLGK